MKRVLLTGPSGFIGRQAIKHLLDAGFEVHTIDIRPLPEELPDAHHHIANLFDPGGVDAAVAQIRPSHLLHFAWFVTPGAFWSSPENLRWVQSSIDLLRTFVEQGGRRSVLAGTCAEYDWSGDGVCDELSTKIGPNTLYGACKAALGLVHEQYARQTGTSAAWGRVFHLYGPFEPPTRLVPTVIRSLLRGEPANCTHGRQLRDFLHVDDVARAFVTLLGSDVEGPVNIASGIPVSIADVAHTIAREVQAPDLVRLGVLTAPESEPVTLVARVDRLRALGFEPRYSIEEGIRSTVGWWRRQMVV
jgi:nucleoside-diphosphate-sugar epimerase